MLYSKIEGQGKPLLILHGFLGMSDNWKTLGTQYAALGFEVHLIDLRNHGRSFHDAAFSYAVMVQDVLKYCTHYGLQTISVMGHSMGGKLAMLLATQYPNLVAQLVVADIGPKYYPQHHHEILTGLNAIDFSTQPQRNEVDTQLQEYIPDFGTRQFLLKNLYWQTPGQLAFRFNLPVLTQEIEQVGTALPESAHYDLPTLFVRGGNSKYILDTDWELILTHFPLAKVETIPNVGHWLHAENPTLFFSITSQFLNS
ncbi:MAG: alpha/beta fold hydrolase [Flavobacterium sp.]|nr:alpha/beta fold hydrolase [Flavobacterium sp.]